MDIITAPSLAPGTQKYSSLHLYSYCLYLYRISLAKWRGWVRTVEYWNSYGENIEGGFAGWRAILIICWIPTSFVWLVRVPVPSSLFVASSTVKSYKQYMIPSAPIMSLPQTSTSKRRDCWCVGGRRLMPVTATGGDGHDRSREIYQLNWCVAKNGDVWRFAVDILWWDMAIAHQNHLQNGPDNASMKCQAELWRCDGDGERMCCIVEIKRLLATS